jgi:pimeloyl-ACP methyl ester carboxylesterase
VQSLRIAVDGSRWLDATVQGNGPRPVVFEAGMGAGHSTWALVAPAVADKACVITYDRAGFGASPVDQEPRTLARAANDLVALLRGLRGEPVVLVGHSYGGLVVREAFALAPELVAALVLVDPSDEGCDLYFTPSARRLDRWFATLLPVGGRLGLARLVARVLARQLPAEARRGVVAESGTVAACRAHQRELAHFDADMARLRDRPHPAVTVALTIVSGTRRSHVQAAARRRDCLVAAHGRRVERVPKGRHVRAERSRHFVMFTEPRLVIREVLGVIGLA